MYGVISGGGVIGSRIAKGSKREVKVDNNFLYVKVDGLDFKPSIIIIEYAYKYYLLTFNNKNYFNTWGSGDGYNVSSGIKPESKDTIHKDRKIYDGYIYMINGGFSVVTAKASTFDAITNWEKVREPQTINYIAIE